MSGQKGGKEKRMLSQGKLNGHAVQLRDRQNLKVTALVLSRVALWRPASHGEHPLLFSGAEMLIC